MFDVEVAKSFKARQGLPSHVLRTNGSPPLAPDTGFEVTIKVGVRFKEAQLKKTGWFVDTDEAEQIIQNCCDYLGSDVWTNLFEFRPTFELVSRWAFERLNGEIQQLRYVQLENKTIGVKTRYSNKSSDQLFQK